ncbi:hypothetical protein [Acetobacter tropicalis]|uniref:Uncharacterized protein n=1 Tax=Acetobacter tropicalis TaxID=104102 RepID=A0A251ZZ36_9PROT|nr:hypothetical protein [Acetobacter tropicalis]OUI79927.1 hypothetical protein HC62_18310 [Acetobacter tropicalis]
MIENEDQKKISVQFAEWRKIFESINSKEEPNNQRKSFISVTSGPEKPRQAFQLDLYNVFTTEFYRAFQSDIDIKLAILNDHINNHVCNKGSKVQRFLERRIVHGLLEARALVGNFKNKIKAISQHTMPDYSENQSIRDLVPHLSNSFRSFETAWYPAVTLASQGDAIFNELKFGLSFIQHYETEIEKCEARILEKIFGSIPSAASEKDEKRSK